MRTPQFRLRVEGLEQRLTPATTADVLSAAAQVAQGAAFFRQTATDPGWIFNSAFKTTVQTELRTIFLDAAAAIKVFQSAPPTVFPAALAGMEALALSNEQTAVKMGGWIGVRVAPIPVVPPKPTPKPTDAGMTNTMPSPTDTHFVPLGTAGLKTWDVVVGTGTPVVTGNTIVVFYTGWLAANGTKFDSRRSPAAPASFALSGLIQGFQQGALGMKPGGIRRVFIPAALGYGAAGSPPNIPANADLVFEIKLISHHP